MSQRNGIDDRIPPGISKEDWGATPPAVRRLVFAQQADLKVAKQVERLGPVLDLFPDRKSRFLFATRVFALVLMIGALMTYVLWDTAEPIMSEALAVSGFKARPKSTPQPTTVIILFPTPVATAVQAETPHPTAPSASGASPAPPTAEPAKPIGVMSQDGLAVLELAPGTKVTDSGGEAVNSISTAAQSPGIRWDIAIVGLSYSFGPATAALYPPARLTITYDPKAYYPFAYENIDCSQMHIAYFDKDKGATSGPWLEVKVDREAHNVTTLVDHLGTFVLFCEVTGAPISLRLAPWDLHDKCRI